MEINLYPPSQFNYALDDAITVTHNKKQKTAERYLNRF